MGTGIGHERDDSTVASAPASMLVLYTDGLIERRSGSLDEGFSALAASVHADVPDPEAACDAILDELLRREPATDDIAMLVMQTAPR